MLTLGRALLVVATTAWVVAHAIQPAKVHADAGGRDVTVALFTTHDLRSVTATPMAPDAWVALCAMCAHKPLSARLSFSSGDLYLSGTLRLEDADAPATAITSSGRWHLRSNGRGIDVVLTMPSERYTAAVVSGEAAADDPEEALRALAIVARTYALDGPHYNAGAGHLPAQLCDSTQCQALRLGPVSHAVRESVDATAGETLWFQRRRAEVFFSQHCGGQTADAREAWSSDARGARPYLIHHADPFCLRKGTASWHTAISLEQLQRVARQEGWHLPAHIVHAGVTRRSQSARAVRLSFAGADGSAAAVSATSLRFAMGRALGWNRIRSDLYDVTLHGDDLVFGGRGHGHGVGLCQAGATEMAVEHRDARAILAFYFPGTHLGISPLDDGWTTTAISGVQVRSVGELPTQVRSDVISAWSAARQRFPVTTTPLPTVVFAPSTELFRQMTGQPGWDLASTRGDLVTLQPESILKRSHIKSGDRPLTFQHELLHVLIEQEATDRAPLWLREGLAEALAVSAFTAPESNDSGARLDGLLRHATSAKEARAAHAVAGARVRQLVRRYGLSTVRDWLKSGVPSSVAAGA